MFLKDAAKYRKNLSSSKSKTGPLLKAMEPVV